LAPWYSGGKLTDDPLPTARADTGVTLIFRHYRSKGRQFKHLMPHTRLLRYPNLTATPTHHWRQTGIHLIHRLHRH
jgi:hypothetical protein